MERRKVINQLHLAVQEAVADLPVIDDIPEKTAKKFLKYTKNKKEQKTLPQRTLTNNCSLQ
jgi:hypothetical protein